MFDRMIIVCYAGGSRGEAIARIIELSPSVYARNGKANSIPNHLGRMEIATRWGWEIDFNVHPMFGAVEYWIRSKTEFRLDQDISPDIVSEWRRIVPNLWYAKDGPNRWRLSDIIKRNHIVIADHMYPAHVHQLLPGSKTVAVCGDSTLAFNLFYDKWLMAHPPDFYLKEPNFDAKTNLDREIANIIGIRQSQISDQERKGWLGVCRQKTMEMMNEFSRDQSSYQVDFQKLFHPEFGYEVYHEMAEYLGIEPNWPDVADFIGTYNSLEPIAKGPPAHLI